MSAKFCPNCGSPIDGAFCGECGHKIQSQPQTGSVSAGGFWSVTLVNLPAAAGQPAEFVVGNATAFSSEGNRNRVNSSFTYPTSSGPTNQITLNLPSVGFSYNKNLTLNDGTHIRFQADENGTMKVRRQHFPF